MKKYSRRAIGMCRTATSAFGAFIRNSALSSASSGLRRQGRCECVAGTWCVSLAKSKQNSPATGGCQRIVERHRHRRIADIVKPARRPDALLIIARPRRSRMLVNLTWYSFC